MAGLKISALPAGTVLADNDLIPYVDVSDTSEAATGTTKYMEKSLLAIPTSGTWTPVISNVAGAATVTIPSGPSYYTRVGDIVTEAFDVSCAMDTLQTTETFNVSTAILRDTDFADDKSVRGTWSVFETNLSDITFISIASESPTKLISITIDTIANANVTIQLNHQYSLV
jgi:hypothetical protein